MTDTVGISRHVHTRTHINTLASTRHSFLLTSTHSPSLSVPGGGVIGDDGDDFIVDLAQVFLAAS